MLSQATTNKSVILKPGEQFMLPPNSTVTAITGSLSSTCDNLPAPQSLECYYFQWELEGPAASGSDAWENATIDEITVGDTVYTVAGDAYLENNDGAAKLLAALTAAGFTNISIPAVALLTNRALWATCFKTTSSIAKKTLLKMHSSDYTYIQIAPRLLSGAVAPPCSCS